MSTTESYKQDLGVNFSLKKLPFTYFWALDFLSKCRFSISTIRPEGVPVDVICAWIIIFVLREEGLFETSINMFQRWLGIKIKLFPNTRVVHKFLTRT